MGGKKGLSSGNRPKYYVEEQCAILLRNIPKLLRDEFSSTCRKRGKNMTTEFRNFMRWYIDQKGSMPFHFPSVKYTRSRK